LCGQVKHAPRRIDASEAPPEQRPFEDYGQPGDGAGQQGDHDGPAFRQKRYHCSHI
jgi:hypothetical protein